MKITFATLVVILTAFLLWGIYSSQQQEAAAAVSDSSPKPIAGAFGITLGKHFNPEMVKEVLSKEQKNYTAKKNEKLLGSVIHIIPNELDNNFQQYLIKTTQKGVIYSIEALYQGDKTMTPALCVATVKKLAGELEAKHGKPRGKGRFGQWYSFRQASDYSKSLRLYAHRCRTGMYSVIYTDDKVRKES